MAAARRPSTDTSTGDKSQKTPLGNMGIMGSNPMPRHGEMVKLTNISHISPRGSFIWVRT